MQIDAFNVEKVFAGHSPKTAQDAADHQSIRAAALEFAKTILRRCPSCADRAVAIQKTREAMMAANAAIDLEGAV